MIEILDRILFIWVVLFLSHIVWIGGIKNRFHEMLLKTYKTNDAVNTVYFLTWSTYMVSIGWLTHRVVWHHLLKWIG